MIGLTTVRLEVEWYQVVSDVPFVTMQVAISKWLKNQDLLGQSNSGIWRQLLV